MALRSAAQATLRHRAHLIVDLAVAALVLALPLTLTGHRPAVAAQPGGPAEAAGVLSADSAAPRAEPIGRGATIMAAMEPVTSVANDVKPIVHYTLGPSDRLESLAGYFKVSPEAIAFSNGISEPDLRSQVGRAIMIPPGEGALYTVQEGETVESVAARFKVAPKAIMDYNRLYFEPEHFAPGQLIFIPGAAVPALVWQVADPRAERVIARPQPANNPAPNGQLAWPVAGYITQYFWAFHSGVDMAAPYGSGIGASADGTVVSTGWVPVGGMSVVIRHADGLATGYYHMGAIYVTPGQQVTRGQIVGTVGMTGVTTGPHVHWEVKLSGSLVNPLSY